MHMAGVHHAIL